MAAITGLAVAGLGFGIQFIAGKKQAKAAKRQSREQERSQALEAQRARRRTIREARIARGAAVNAASQVGAGESSGAVGGVSGLASQAGANLGFNAQTEGIGRNISKFGRKIASAQSLGAIGSGVAGIGSNLFSAGGGFDTIFGPTQAPGLTPFSPSSPGSLFTGVRPGR